MKSKYFIFIFFMFLASCYKNHLYVQHEKMDASYLASTHVGTPDPRKKNPPKGQTLSIAWDFPLSLYRENLTIILTVRFWDNKQDIFVYKIERKRGYQSYKFQDYTEDNSKKILTYKIDVFNEDGVLVDEWRHQFWKELIEINKEEDTKVNVDEVDVY